MVGITSYGAYIPYYRLPRSVINKAWGRPGGGGEKAVAGFDEDPITMSVAAGMDCLKGIDPKTIDALFLATTSAPYKERQNATIVATVLDMRRETRNTDFANCLRAGTNALLAAADAVDAGSLKNVLVTAADMRLGGAAGEDEQAFGDGSAALLLGNEKVAVEIEGSYTLSDDLSDYWRSHEDTFVRSWEDRFGRDEGYSKIPVEVAKGVMQKFNLTPQDFAKVCFYGANARAHAGVGRAMGFTPEQIQNPLLDTVGNTGAALPLMILVAALEEAKPGDRILLVSYGNGSDAIMLRVTDEIEKIRDRRGIKRHLESKMILPSYGKYLRFRDLMEWEFERRPPDDSSLPVLWRQRNQILRFHGGRCRRCGIVQYPIQRICAVCQSKDEYDEVRLSDKRGQLFTYGMDERAMVKDLPNVVCVVDLFDGGRVYTVLTDRDPAKVKVGMTVEMTIRNLHDGSEIHNYFWKARPVRC